MKPLYNSITPLLYYSITLLLCYYINYSKTNIDCFLMVHLCNMLTTPAVWLDLYLKVLKHQDYFVLKHAFT